MPVPTFSGYRRLTKAHKYSAAGVAAAGAAAMVFAVVPGAAEAEQGAQSAQALSAKRVTETQTDGIGKIQKEGLVPMPSDGKSDAQAKKAEEDAQAKKTEELARQKKAAEDMAKKKEEFAAKAKADQERAAKEAANRSEARKPAPGPKKPAPAPKKYANNLDGWIRESLDIMKKHNIPGTYEGIHRNIMRESSGNPRAINNWDINAVNGVPSKGLLQVIKPTFDAYHVPGTVHDQYNPVANIVAACNYAADRYGSIDNVDSAY